MTLDEGCDTPSTTFEWRKVRTSKLPPGGGRAAAGGTTGPSGASSGEASGRPPKGTKWLAVTYLGGATCRYRVQLGNTVRFVDGFIQLVDVVALLSEPAAERRAKRLPD